MTKTKLLKRQNKQRLEDWRIAVKTKYDNKCAICGKTKRLNCHHLLPYRLYKEFRYEAMNGILLCPGCHKYSKGSAHQDPIIFVNWLQNKYPLTYNWLIRSSIGSIQNKNMH